TPSTPSPLASTSPSTSTPCAAGATRPAWSTPGSAAAATASRSPPAGPPDSPVSCMHARRRGSVLGVAPGLKHEDGPEGVLAVLAAGHMVLPGAADGAAEEAGVAQLA